MMDVEFGTNTSCVILSLMGVDDQPRKKLIREHKRVLSDEYHQRAASVASHIKRSSFNCYQVETSQNCEPSQGSAAIGRSKRCKMSIDKEGTGDSVSYRKKESDEMALADELVSGIYTSRSTARLYVPFNDSSDPLRSFKARLSRKRSLGRSYMDNRRTNCSEDLFGAHFSGCIPKSQSSVVYSGRGSTKERENVASEPTTGPEVAFEKVCVEAKDGERLRRTGMTGMSASCFRSKRNCCPLPAYLIADGTERVCEIENETSPYDSEDSFCTDRTGIETDSFNSFEDKYLRSPDSVLESFDGEGITPEIMANLSEHAANLPLFGFDPSTACSGEIGTSVFGDEDCEDQCIGASAMQDNLKPSRVSENREFNYLVEILTEAGFCQKNLMSNLNKWHTVESPLSPFVFESVEKRYTDDKSWEASDRELLFDQMNSWLEGFLQRCMSAPLGHAPGRFSHWSLQDIDKEALWSSLVKKGKELKGETTEDLLKHDLGSLDLAGFIESIIAEIDWSVINELITELITGE